MHAPNSIVLKHIKEKLTELKGETDKHTLIMGDFKTPLSVTLYKQIQIQYDNRRCEKDNEYTI